jgi:hypothetical protein
LARISISRLPQIWQIAAHDVSSAFFVGGVDCGCEGRR